MCLKSQCWLDRSQAKYINEIPGNMFDRCVQLMIIDGMMNQWHYAARICKLQQHVNLAITGKGSIEKLHSSAAHAWMGQVRILSSFENDFNVDMARGP